MCEGLLGALKTHPQLGSKVAEVLASLGKEGKYGIACQNHSMYVYVVVVDAFRDVAVSCGVVPALLPLLTSDDRDAQLQSLRAIGNLCFNHGTKVVLKNVKTTI